MHLLDLMEPEETVGNLWHDMASRIGAEVSYPEASVTLASVRPSLAVLFRSLGGAAGVELALEAAVIEPLSDEPDVQQALRDLIETIYG